jgi:hypothetical protein
LFVHKALGKFTIVNSDDPDPCVQTRAPRAYLPWLSANARHHNISRSSHMARSLRSTEVRGEVSLARALAGTRSGQI